MKQLILASASPRRKEILEITGLRFSVAVSDYEEDLGLSMETYELAKFLSYKKAESVAGKFKNALIIGADTFIVHQGRLLGKPDDERDAVEMLRELSGKVHSVITGFTILDTGSDNKQSGSVETKVHFKKLSSEEIFSYVETKEPFGKAGAYAIQGLGAIFVEKIEGDFFNVVGLPLCALVESLKEFGVKVV